MAGGMTENLLETLGPDYPFEEGVVLPIDKPIGWTSTDVVRKVQVLMRRLGHRKIKVGHAGTLDPLATGVLLVCVGRATKRVNDLQAEEKEYRATIELGATTPSYDLEHPIDARYPWQHITRQGVEEALRGFVGEQEQEPPVYSAKKLEGRRAYEYAREGEEVRMRKALITIYEAQLEACGLPDEPKVEVRITCSKGTYIRSFARDLGRRLASGAHLVGLRRLRSGGFTVEQCLDLRFLETKLTPSQNSPETNPH